MEPISPTADTPPPAPKPRRPWLAALLSLLGNGPVGQIYAGRLRRSLVLWLLMISMFLTVTVVATVLPIGRFGLLLLAIAILAAPFALAADAFLLARRNRLAPPKRYQRWWVYILFLAFFCFGSKVAAELFRSFVGEAFCVYSRAMSPTILPGERILVDKLPHSRRHIHRGSIVAYRTPDPDPQIFIHRVAALPGDLVEIKNERLFVNGLPADDPHAVFTGPFPPAPQVVNFGPLKIPDDCCFLLGDNRRISLDSRLIGPIPLSRIYGVARFIYWSRELTFPDPHDTKHTVPGPFHWNRLGQRLD